MRYKDKVVLVTGGAQGIGMGVSAAFAAEGARVVIADLDEEAGREAEAVVRASGGEAVFIKADTGCEERVIELVERLFPVMAPLIS